MIIDLHIHTYHSSDSLMKPDKIVKTAKSVGLTGIAVSDHNTIQGGLECKRVNKDDNFLVIVGAEISTEVGDIIGLFLHKEILSRKFADVVEEIQSQSGLVLLSHPFKGHKLDEIDFNKIDLIEGYNSRLHPRENQKAIELAEGKNIPIVAGSDAHFYSEIGNCRTIYRSKNLLHPIKTVYRRNIFYTEIVSQFLKAKKNNDVKLFVKLLKWTPKYILRRLVEK